MIENKKVISRSLIVLFLSLSMVYSLTYMKKATLFKSHTMGNIENRTTTGGLVETEDSGSMVENSANLSAISNEKNSVGMATLGGSEKSGGVTNSNTQALDTRESYTSIKMLSGTSEYFGVLDIVSILGEKPKFTLQDVRGNYFVYYGDHLNFIQTVQALGGNVYEMVTEAEILQNQLFGDRVSYINLSTFKGVRVLMVIEIDGDVWLLQVPADKYHYSKDYLKSLFIQ